MTDRQWQTAGMTVSTLTGDAIRSVIPDVAALRIAVFRDFPYLYDGDLDYERDYLAKLCATPRAVVIIARAGERIVGAATGAPLIDVDADWSAPFLARGMTIDNRFYCAESVLLAEWRGMGIGHAFFDEREAHARALGMNTPCFCSVLRPDDHPARPRNYRGNDGFWRKRGYRPLAGVVAGFSWRDIGNRTETGKALQFWGREL